MTSKTQIQSLAESQDLLSLLVEDVLQESRKLGASAAQAGINTGQGLSVTVRLGEVETIEHIRDKGLGITVYFGQKSGSASTSDLSPAAWRDTVRAACSIAKYTADDPCNGLAEGALLATEFPDLDLYHPWHPSVEEAIDLSRRCETTARDHDQQIRNSEGATLSVHEGLEVYGNTHGFIATVAASRHSLSCSMIAQDSSGMQRDYWYTTARDSTDLLSPEAVGTKAASRAVRRLNGKKLTTRQVPVVFEAPVASSLLSHFIAAISGSSLYRQASFLLDHLDKRVFAEHVRIYEQPHLLKGLGSASFDNEGVVTRERDIVTDGILKGYVLDSYSACKLGMQTTGNAGGVHNLTITSGRLDLEGLLQKMHTGLLVTELIGFGVNTVTGDYSRGAAGFWVENGEIQYPVEEITIAGNLKDMYTQLQEVGSDIDIRGNVRTGSILIGNMTVAGD